MTLNLAFWHPTFSLIMDRLLDILRSPLLVVVARTDIAIVPDQRVCLEQNIEYLLGHPLIERLVCATPEEAIGHLRFDPLNWWKKRNYKRSDEQT